MIRSFIILVISMGSFFIFYSNALAFQVTGGCSDGVSAHTGQSGTPATCGSPGVATGGRDSGLGQDGQTGGPGGNCSIQISGAKPSDKIRLGITAKGGHGGKGGKGGDGVACGLEYLVPAHGANGGDGGPGGRIKITSDQPITASQISFPHCPVAGGDKGAGGAGGHGVTAIIKVPNGKKGRSGRNGSLGQILLTSNGQTKDITKQFCK